MFPLLVCAQTVAPPSLPPLPPLVAYSPPPPPAQHLCRLLTSNLEYRGRPHSCVYTATGANLTWGNLSLASFEPFGLRLHVAPCTSEVLVYVRVPGATHFKLYRKYPMGERTMRRHPMPDITANTTDGLATLEIEMALTGQITDGNFVVSLGACVGAAPCDGLITGLRGILPRPMLQVLSGDFSRYWAAYCPEQLSPPPPPAPHSAPAFCAGLVPTYSGANAACVDALAGATLSWPEVKVGPAAHPSAFDFGMRLEVLACASTPQLFVSFKYNLSSAQQPFLAYRQYPLLPAPMRRLPVHDVTYQTPDGLAIMELLIEITGGGDALNVSVAIGAFLQRDRTTIDSQIPFFGAALPATLIHMSALLRPMCDEPPSTGS